MPWLSAKARAFSFVRATPAVKRSFSLLPWTHSTRFWPQRPRPTIAALITLRRLRGLRTDALDELLRRPLAPLRDQSLFGRQQVGSVPHVEPIRIGPVLVHAAPWVGPVVVDLAAEEMPANAPHVLVLAEMREMLMSHEHVVEVLHLEGEVIQARALVPDAEEHVMIDVVLAPIAPVERPDDVVLRAHVDVVRADEAERVAEPAHGRHHIGRRHHAVADPLHARGALRDPHQRAGPLQ